MRYELIKKDSLFDGLNKIFDNRGINPKDIEHYLNVSADDINSPTLLSNIDNSIYILMDAIIKNKQIGVVVDSDMDGFTSAALIINYLNKLFPNWTAEENNIVYYIHSGKQHGLEDSLNKIYDSNVKLVLVIDAGTNDWAQIQELQEKNIDCIIIDHHLINEDVSPHKYLVNNQIGDYPNKTLSGVGIAYKFCKRIDEMIGTKYADYYLDLVACGMIADLMPLNKDYETLYYMREGLKKINNPFLEAVCLINEYLINKKGGLNPYTVGFYIAPLVNAVIRTGSLEDKQLVFESMLDLKGKEFIEGQGKNNKDELVSRASEAVRVAKNIKDKQSKIKDTNFETIKGIIEDQNLLNNKIIIVPLPKELDMDKNVLGLIANNVISIYKKPVMLLNEIYKDDVKMWSGSCRNCHYSPIINFKELLEGMPQVIETAGHASAFGATVLGDKITELNEALNEKLKDYDFSNFYKVDFIFDSDFDPSIIFDITSLDNYWGQAFEKPYLAIKNIKVNKNNVQLLSPNKSPTLKITLPNGVSLIKFKSSQEEFESLTGENVIGNLEIVGTCVMNYWNGNAYPQIEITDYNLITKYDF